MKIAVALGKNELVSQRFGTTEEFKIYTAKKGKVIDSEILDTDGVKGPELAGFLSEHDVDVVLSGLIGDEAKKALAKECIVFFPGVVGKADYQVEDFLKGNLSFNGTLSCTKVEE